MPFTLSRVCLSSDSLVDGLPVKSCILHTWTLICKHEVLCFCLLRQKLQLLWLKGKLRGGHLVTEAPVMTEAGAASEAALLPCVQGLSPPPGLLHLRQGSRKTCHT